MAKLDKPLKNPETNSMHTSIDCLLNGEPAKRDGYMSWRIGGACFAPARDMLRIEGKFSNKYMDQVKYYPWVRKYSGFDMEYWTEKWLKVALSIPFIKNRVIEYTGYDYNALYPTEDEEYIKAGAATRINKDKYFLIDFTVPVDEPFVVCSVLRTPQEYPDQIVTFSKVLKETDNELMAFAASLYFGKLGTPRTGGHAPCNGIDLKFWWDFVRDPSIAVSKENAWRSNVLGGQGHLDIKVNGFVQSLTQEDPPVHDVLVYGSLRKGMGNHALLKRGLDNGGAIDLGGGGIEIHARLYDTGCGFPALVPEARKNVVMVEAYRVNNAVMADLDRLEGYPHFYDRKQVLFNGNPSWVYFQREAREGYNDAGHDWVHYKRAVA
ncbi:MAG: gamma-glutamylcyclotransferase [Gammaproteobacteria bacterium]|nr:gamma-glutamylcyclotransferase [Gammaproteobacteria bacterium]MCW8982476.1 gamma-glutamylcyclotransferase [Gammaproteobacteria bacterium]